MAVRLTLNQESAGSNPAPAVMPTNSNEYDRNWYARNQEVHKARVLARKRETRVWLDELKSTLSCGRCNENHPACLEFHHRNPALKEIALGDAVARGWSKRRILSEIEKCDVLCSNCHRKEHAALAQLDGATAL